MEKKSLERAYRTVNIADLQPYPNNPRINENAVDSVAKSIEQCGYIAPIIVDENNVILAGHTRLKALQKLGRETAQVVIIKGMTEEEKRKYRLLDNKTDELSSWDFDLLSDELDGLDFGDLDLDWGISQKQESGEKYTDTVNVPQYEPNEDEIPEIEELTDESKTQELLENIDSADVTDEEKEFLKTAAMRHVRFNYRRIADYYANASEEMQKLMEESALVIIDADDAIKNGYARFKSQIGDCI